MIVRFASSENYKREDVGLKVGRVLNRNMRSDIVTKIRLPIPS